MKINLINFRNDKDLSQTQLGEILGSKQPNISAMEKEGRDLTPEQYDILANKFGEEELLKYKVDDVEIQNNSLSIEYAFPARPFVEDVKAACGFPNGFSNSIMKSGHKMATLPVNIDYDFSIEATGDSMISKDEPDKSICSGDILALKIITTRTYIRWGEVYSLATNDDIITKKIMPSDNDGCIKCVSYNSDEFPPFDIPVDEILSWAMVKAVVGVKKY